MNIRSGVMDPLNTHSVSDLDEVELLKSSKHPDFLNFNEDEDVSCIEKLTWLRISKMKMYFLVPILCLLTGMIFALCLFWSPKLRIKWFYDETDEMD